MDIKKKCKYSIVILLLSILVCSRYSEINIFAISTTQADYYTHYTDLEPPENPSFKVWCESKFLHGNSIYNAYRQIAFQIRYTEEPPQNDFWQTPLETIHRHAGDCEDAVLLFNNFLPHNINNGRIVWGIIEDLKNNVTFAHVWFELVDRKGELYLVDPFTNDWNGITHLMLLKDKRIKKEIVGIPNKLIGDLLDNDLELGSIRRLMVKDGRMFDPNLSMIINDIFAKLRRVSLRYIEQKRLIAENQ